MVMGVREVNIVREEIVIRNFEGGNGGEVSLRLV